MKHFLLSAFLFALIPSLGFAQEILFDDPHQTDGALFLKLHNGKEVAFNAAGTIAEVDPVFQQSMQSRKAKGLTVGISSDGTRSNRLNGESGPTFNLTYLDQVNASGIGFDDPIYGAQRRATLEAAFAYFSSSMLDVGEAEIEIRASFSGAPNSSPFAFSGAYYYGSKGFNDPFTVRHITTGNDPSGSYPDAYIQFNFHSGMNFSYEVDGTPAADQYDFYTVTLHEIMHLLGFSSYCTADGVSAASPNVFTSFDGNLVDFEKNPLFQLTGTGASATVSRPATSLFTNNLLWFDLGSGRVAPVFSPVSFNGSSISHFDNGRTTHGEFVMHPSLSRGQSFRHLHEDEVGVLERIGYTMNYSLATSIEDEEGNGPVNQSFSGLYPNPATSDYGVQINIPEINTPEILVIVYDMMGRESYSKVILNQGSGPITAIDPYHNLSPGMYIVVGSSNDELFNEKLVIK
jgi:hypothetical protein